jgi:hypothetical protein
MIQTMYLLPFCQISTFFFDKKFYASESSSGLYPAWMYSLSQLILELWVIVLCTLTYTVIAVPMMGLWNYSFKGLSSIISMFSVLCMSGLVGNSLVMVSD